ncbi:MAG TPA: hypothetical protein VKQ73_11340 [Stellaceae bacterium]|nr:hypothetical protein [Stellaceae bacterium]
MKVLSLLLGLTILSGLVSGCSGDAPVATAQQAGSEQLLKKDCADPKWRDQNLGLWYSVCRQPLRW